jgi:hypothetical protein
MDEETTAEALPENEEGLSRSISQKQRDAMPASDFAGEGTSFPIPDQEHLDAAVKLLGHESPEEQTKIKARIKEIAKRKGLSLPQSWQDEDKSDDKADRVADVEPVVEIPAPVIERNPVAVYEALTSQPVMPEHPSLYAPITRIDAAKREVECVATSEAIDSYGTIFSYEGSKRAFQRWIDRTANVREMHDRKAVAKGVGVLFDDANKMISLRSRISKAAQDTWIKVEENILTGYSVGATKPVWGKIERNGVTYPYLLEYDLSEVSLVDNPSNPDAYGLAICRADGLTDAVDVEPEEIVQPEPDKTTPASSVAVVVSPSLSTPDLERAGARLSADSRASLHTMRDQAMQLCGCDDCVSMGTPANGNDDGDGDNDNDMAERMERYLAPALTRIHLIAGQLSRSNASNNSTLDAIQSKLDTIETAFTTALERVATNSEIERVSSSLEAIKVDVERIAAQPAPGGPILNGARPAEKHLATDSRSAYTNQQDMTMDMLLKMQKAGLLDTPEKQVAAAALAVQPTRGYMG